MNDFIREQLEIMRDDLIRDYTNDINRRFDAFMKRCEVAIVEPPVALAQREETPPQQQQQPKKPKKQRRPREMTMAEKAKATSNVKRRGADAVETCYKCAVVGGECKNRKKIAKSARDHIFKNMCIGFKETADTFTVLETITLDLKQYWLCGIHLRSGADVDLERLAPDYMEFCDVLKTQKDLNILNKLQKAATKVLNTKRLSIPRIVTTKQQQHQNHHQAIAPQFKKIKTTDTKQIEEEEEENKADEAQQIEEDEEDEENKADEAQQIEDDDEEYDDNEAQPMDEEEDEDVAEAQPMDEEGGDEKQPTNEEIMSIIDMQMPQALKKLDKSKCEHIYNSRCPDPDVQIFIHDDAKKICVVTELQTDKDVDPMLYCGFYGEKYTGLKDATPRDLNTHWISCEENTFIKAGATEQDAKQTMSRLKQFANSILDAKHRT